MSTHADDMLTALSECTERLSSLIRVSASQRGWCDAVSVRQLAMYSLISSSLRCAVSLSEACRSPTRSTLERLPPRVLESIFDRLHLRSCIAFSQTCRTARNVAMSTPRLWTSVKVGPFARWAFCDGDLAPGRARDWTNLTGALEIVTRCRKADLPARAAVSFAASCLDDPSSIACLQGILRRTTTARLEPYSQGTSNRHVMLPSWHGRATIATTTTDHMSEITSSEWNTIADILCDPAPLLEVLEISTPRNPEPILRDGGRFIPSSVLGGQPGQLRVCHLDGFCLGSLRVSAFSSLTTFDYQPGAGVLFYSDIALILDQMPVLQMLGVCGQLNGQPPDGGTQLRHICLMRVALAILGHSGDWDYVFPPTKDVSCLVTLLRDACTRWDLDIFIDFRRPARVSFFHGQSEPFPRDLAPERPQEIYAGHNSSLFRGDDTTILAGAVRTLSSLMTTAVGELIDLSALVHLTISDIYWPEFTCLHLTMPLVKSICITLLRCSTADRAISDIPNIFSVAKDSHDVVYPTLDCPALETITFSFLSNSESWVDTRCRTEWFHTPQHGETSSFLCACRNGGILSLADVHAFLLTSIRFPAPVRELRLFGIRETVDIDPVATFLALTSIADDIVVREEVAQEVKYTDALREQRYGGTQHWAPSHVFDAFRPSAFSVDSESFDHIGRYPEPWLSSYDPIW
ncbi:hypothetical protein EXIGLDRAFT_838151 [Exidia glandulosa HHB12029]|uniref:F-box domain-containing protein n=1 Tax=Exidia glandulosa HHB12029 TaxID=1314781 RepID=A0A165G4Q7_EXIGL|nr:hypothetical protein EXIGLDRAFT_838151 [Exidia glandulosa HHB12029]